MGNRKSQSGTTRKKEPHRAGVSKAPNITTVFAEMAWQVAIPFMLFTLLGNWIDGKQGTSPLFTIIGLFIGIGSVSLVVHRLIEKHYPDTTNKETKE